MILVQSSWEQFCSAIKSDVCVTVSELPNLNSSGSWIAIKHDVETNVTRALDIAKIEAKHGIKATYFVQHNLLSRNKSLLKEIAKLGHEVTYHYDVLDSNKGNMDKAIAEFSRNVSEFEKAGFEVTSVCPHGNPMMQRNGWASNKDFFRCDTVAERFKNIFDLVVQGKEKIKQEYTYISDAGYGFKIISDITDNDKNKSRDVSLENINALISITNTGKPVVISTHPHRWSKSYLAAFFAKLRFFSIRKVATLASKSSLLKRLMSKFYFLAKNI
jgi:hypothetical protein